LTERPRKHAAPVNVATFFGRDRELGELDVALADARAGRGRSLSIVGDPGIGKTRLVEEFAQRNQGTIGRVLWGRCPEGGATPAYWPWRQALAPLLASKRDPAGATTDARLALLAAAPGTAASKEIGSDQARFSFLEAVVELLRSGAAENPLVLVLDDAHWADQASLELLGHLARELREDRILLLATYRQTELRQRVRLPGEIARFSRTVALQGLARAEIAQLVASHCSAQAAAAVVERLASITEGNPFFLDELLALLRATGDLDGGAEALQTIDLPASIREAVRRRIDPLDPGEQALLELAAVIGREFPLHLLATASDTPLDATLTRIAAALAAGLVHETSEPGTFRFAHALIREVLYAGLLPAARVVAHRRIALALEQHADEDAATLSALAHHFFCAVTIGEADKASLYAERAGRAARRQLAYDEAAKQLDRALSALGFAVDDPPRRLKLLLTLGDSVQHTGDMVRAAEIFFRAARLARERDDAASLAVAAMRHAFARGAFLPADVAIVGLLDLALTAIGPDDHPLRVLLLTALSAALLFSRERERCASLCDEALAMARRIGEPRTIAAALDARHLLLLGSPDLDERLALGNESLATARAAGRRDVEWTTLAPMANDLLEAGDLLAAERAIARLEQLAEASRSPVEVWGALTAKACLALLAGRFADAERLGAEAIAARRAGQDAAAIQIFVTQSLVRRLETSGVADVEEMVRRFASDFQDNQGWLPALALLLAESGREDEARSLYGEVAALGFDDVPNNANFLGTASMLAILMRRLGDAERARILHARLAPFASHATVTFVQPVVCMGSIARYLGLLAATMGDAERALRHFEDAIARNRALGARPYLARSLAECAAVLRERDASGDRERAAALVAEAREIAEAIGQFMLLDELARVTTAPAARTSALSAVAPAAASAPASASSTAREPAAAPPPERAGAASSAELKRNGDVWRVSFGPATFLLKDSKGLQFLVTLLRNPGREVHVLDLVTSDGAADEGSGGEAAAADLGDAGELLDPDARAAYRRRLEDLRDELEEAERFHDPGRAARAQSEIEFLTAELSRAVGLGGRMRRAGGAGERARQNASRTIAAALKKIAQGSPELGQHLAATVSTGLFCCYDPRLVPPLSWIL
jgi:tetratricopeptide (TPR) repeat protein